MSYFDYPVTPNVHTTFVHPEYQYWLPAWTTIRDCSAGEMEIKRKGQRYLPKIESMDPDQYKDYLDRAVFFNMTGRTVTGLMGTLFRRNPMITGVPDSLDTSNVSKRGQSLIQFAKEIGREVIQTGRYGVLLDMDENGEYPPYFSGYLAENIVDWTVREIAGRWVVTEIILRELRLEEALVSTEATTKQGTKVRGSQNPNAVPSGRRTVSQDTNSQIARAARRWIAAYRVLRLEPDPTIQNPNQMIYRQYYHWQPDRDATPEDQPFEIYTPNWKGTPFKFIPFVFFGPNDNTPDVEKSPILDIVTLNISHYRSYAQLEHGRFYTALPVYYVSVSNSESKGEYTIGPSVVWEIEKDGKVGILEYNGSGLKALLEACDRKEDQIAALGGRLVGVEKTSAGESNNKLKVKEQNEQALLLNISNVLDVGLTTLLRWWAQWQDMNPGESLNISFDTNKDFLSTSTGAREFRAIQMMFEAGIIPVEVLFDYLNRAEVIPDWLSMEGFKEMLNDPDSFPNMADVLSRQRGAPNAETEWEHEHVLTNPQVAAVLGYTSQAPAGQQPLPGQTQGGPVTQDQTLPPNVTATPGASESSSTGPDGSTKKTKTAAPKRVNRAPLVPGPVVQTPPRSTVRRRLKQNEKDEGVQATDIGNQTPNQPLGDK